MQIRELEAKIAEALNGRSDLLPVGSQVAAVSLLAGRNRRAARKLRANADAGEFTASGSVIVTLKKIVRRPLPESAPATPWGFKPILLPGEPMSQTLRRLRGRR